MSAITPFRIDIPAQEIEDLKERLRLTRLPEKETPDDWSQGVPLAYAREIKDYWQADYDWAARQTALNRFDQFTTEIDGLDIHFIHVESPTPARDLWSSRMAGPVRSWSSTKSSNRSSIRGSRRKRRRRIPRGLPFTSRLRLLRQAERDGMGRRKDRECLGHAHDAARLLELSRPGRRLGRRRHDGDRPRQCRALCRHSRQHAERRSHQSGSRESDRTRSARLRGGRYYNQWGAGYSKQQSTRPQTLGYGLVDSPMGQAAWIIEKFYEWTDCNGHPENVLTRDELLDNVMLYWLPGAGASSGRLYWESFNRAFGQEGAKTVELPTGCSIFPKEIVPTPRSWAEQRYTNIVYWNELDRGGHFAAFEQPELFVNELRACFRTMI